MSNLRTIALLAASLLTSVHAFADSWRYQPKKIEQEDKFGEVRIVKSVDGRKDQKYPDFAVTIYQLGKMVALYKGVSYQKLFASPDNDLFVGLSNDGIPGTAVIIFDKSGNLRLEAKHGIARFQYCEESITLVRKWFDEDRPEVSFVQDNEGRLKTITLRDCKGNTVDLMKTILQAYNVSFHVDAERK